MLQALVSDPADGQLVNIKINDIIFIESVNRIITYHHKNGKVYKAPQRLEDFEKSIILKYMKLFRLDHRNFVKISAIKNYNKNDGIVYLNNDYKNTNNKTFAHVAEKNSAFLDLSLGLVEESREMFALVIKEEDKDLININIDDCLKIESVNRIITYHHRNGCIYSTPQKMRDFSTSHALKELGIVRLDHRNLVNLNYIRSYDVQEGLVYFEKDAKPCSKNAHVAAKNRSFLKAHLELNNEKL
ncbi:LytTR family transcriptional regulator DNA-binding domain-containing protein [Paenibacillus sp. 276b]|uniref:LytTR family transcriptional regulator DNA-binding domain-containing protein n=1 Tax=Paenibacillus sp. 276b TaxID=1566277 RepID=UPI00089C31ED|nr:LytTR family transcriptional regulator DNA-binding domain-containing protein [Paenibacillus sp. 276b]SEB27490.1 LytTr DNA-binding domain-containing protein [Paenibacillus sp. 276b]